MQKRPRPANPHVVKKLRPLYIPMSWLCPAVVMIAKCSQYLYAIYSGRPVCRGMRPVGHEWCFMPFCDPVITSPARYRWTTAPAPATRRKGGGDPGSWVVLNWYCNTLVWPRIHSKTGGQKGPIWSISFGDALDALFFPFTRLLYCINTK